MFRFLRLILVVATLLVLPASLAWAGETTKPPMYRLCFMSNLTPMEWAAWFCNHPSLASQNVMQNGQLI